MTDILLSLVRPALALAVLAAGLLGAPTAPRGAKEVLSGPVPAQVVRVIDGDTIEVRARIWLGQEVTVGVRVLGVDTPELKGKCAAEREAARRARDFVAARLADAAITLRDITHDKYGNRVVARIVLPGGEDLAELLIGDGLGVPYGGGRKAKAWCA